MANEPVRVLVTSAAGKIGYALFPMIAGGNMLGPHQPVIFHMLDNPSAAVSLNEVKMQLVDAAFPLLKGVVASTDVVEACTGVNVAIMLYGFPEKEGMEKKEAIAKNFSIYESQASALEKHAAANCKIVVVGDLANTNAFILKDCAPSIPEKNISCLTRSDQNRALGQLSGLLDIQVSDARNLIAWGNCSSTQYLDLNHAIVVTPDGERPVLELVDGHPWLTEGFVSTTVQRAAAMMRAGKITRALPEASAVCDHIRDGSYNVPAGLFYSFPVTCANGEWNIVQGLPIDELSRNKLDLIAEELSEEKAFASSCFPDGKLKRGYYNFKKIVDSLKRYF